MGVHEAGCVGVARHLYVRAKCCASQNNQTAGANLCLAWSTKMQHTPAPNLQPLCRQEVLCESPEEYSSAGRMGMRKEHSLDSQEEYRPKLT